MESAVLVTQILWILGCVFIYRLGVYNGKRAAQAKLPPVAGVLKVETSDPEGPYLFLELHDDVQSIMRRDAVTFSVEETVQLTAKNSSPITE